MSNNPTTQDYTGTVVTAGSAVRIMRIPPSIFNAMNAQEKEQIESMLGEIFLVYEVDQYGCAWIEKWWHKDETHASSHSLALEPSDMEVVSDEYACPIHEEMCYKAPLQTPSPPGFDHV
ncbi:hypothetical protein WAE56_20545 [Iodobacter sp. LRB]|uniref:hypothetical protein n=1 Tax=unclassified Iodobacter TaxID=235634 RepID=UPI000C0F741E|nr:hypothetical protein [Iodobacter sp. BJB302]PHU99572.1 hypothetical protein CSQ88_21800 [Iodobacter sp. BJB302]